MKIPSLEKIVTETLAVIEGSKSKIYDIAENTRSEMERVKRDLMDLQRQVLTTVDRVDNLEKLEKSARIRLMEVSKNYNKYSEEEVKFAYERARELQLELGSLREREHQLKLRRNELERSLRRLMTTVDKAEGLVAQVGVVLDYLGGNLRWINDELELVNQKRLVAPRIIQAQEEERRRVAREIHDGPAQSLANVVLRSEVCEQLLDSNTEEARRELQELRGIVRNSLQDVRRIIFDLRPMALDDLGLVPALTRYVETLKEKNGVNISINCSGQRKRLDATVEVALFRVVQEGVQNIIKHANATCVSITLEIGSENIMAVIKDNGAGFDAEEYMKAPKPNSYGIVGMKERLEILGGQFSIRSKPGEGTEIIALLPLD